MYLKEDTHFYLARAKLFKEKLQEFWVYDKSIKNII